MMILSNDLTVNVCFALTTDCLMNPDFYKDMRFPYLDPVVFAATTTSDKKKKGWRSKRRVGGGSTSTSASSAGASSSNVEPDSRSVTISKCTLEFNRSFNAICKVGNVEQKRQIAILLGEFLGCCGFDRRNRRLVSLLVQKRYFFLP